MSSSGQVNSYAPLREVSSSDDGKNGKKSGNDEQGTGAANKLSPLQIVALCATWFGLGLWIYSFIILEIPGLPMFSAGQDSCPKAHSNSGGTLGSLYAYGALVSMFVAPTAGLLSDKTKTRWGRRYPYVLLGFLGVAVSVWGIPFGNKTIVFISFAVVQMFFSISVSAYNGVVADVVPDSQRGLISGALGSATAMGNLCGAAMNLLVGKQGAFPVNDTVYTIIIHILMFACLAFSWYVLPEKGEWVLSDRDTTALPQPLLSLENDEEGVPAEAEPNRRSSSPPSLEISNPFQAAKHKSAYVFQSLVAFLEPLKDKDFLLVVLTRFLVQMGIYTVQEFLLWYIACTIDLPKGKEPKFALNVVLAPLIACSILSATVSGYLSDSFGGRRKIIVYGSTAIMFTICLVFAFQRTWALSPWLGAIFGIGYGALLSIDYALALDAAPSVDEAAKDLGIWNLALVLPLTVAAPVGGYLLDHFNTGYTTTWIEPCHAGPGSSCNGYVVLFVLSGLYFAFASLAVFCTSDKIK